MRKPILLSLLLYGVLSSCNSIKEPVDYVDTFIGTDGHGHTYPGASMPFGMVQLSPDTRIDSWDGCSGYHYSDSTILGFSHTHLSGTGIGDYGDIRLMPTVGAINLNPGSEEEPESGYRSRFSHKTEKTSPGYYSVYLDDYDVEVELSVGERFGLHKYEFPKTTESNIIIDLVEGVTTDKIIDLSLKMNFDGSFSGHRITEGWANDQRVYFHIEFSELFTEFGIQQGQEIYTEKNIEYHGENIKAWVRFNTITNQEVFVKVGISGVSAKNAKLNADESNQNWDLGLLKSIAEDTWNRELSKISVKGGTKEQKTIFYTALYHSFLNPNLFSDMNGEYRGQDGNIHYSTDNIYTVFSLWDTFRAAHPLYTITQESRVTGMINSMLDMYEKGGLLPVWELAGNETNCMIGYHAIPVIADAYFKGIEGIDYEKALDAMIVSATEDQFGLQYYKELGYIPAGKEGESVSKTLEYAYDDWCIAMMAMDLGNKKVFEEFILRAQNYKNIFDVESGFMRGKMNGGFVNPFDPTQVNFMLTEANTWQYNFFVPHDVSGLMKLLGGKEKFVKKLDELFYTEVSISGRQQSDITGLIGQYAHGNEPSHHMAYLYNYAGYPEKAAPILRKIMSDLYTDQPTGLCGNEDCGQLSAWYVMSAMGFYPVCPGDNNYIIGSPIFGEVTIKLDDGNSFIIKANKVSSENMFIQSAKLNGEEYDKSYFTHQDLRDGGVLEFEMGSTPSNWGKAEESLPVSTIEKNLQIPVPYFQTESTTFTEKLEVELFNIIDNNGLEIYYTLNGNTPDRNATLYENSIVLNQTKTIKAIAFINEATSKVVTAKYHKIPGGRSISIKNPYSTQYTAGGDIALIDFIRGGNNFRTGSWQGYYGVDLDVTLDLGKVQHIQSIAAGFLQDQNSWIFMPTNVVFQISLDGEKFYSVAGIINNVPERDDGGIIKEFEKKNINQQARFVRVFAKNIGLCPEWHKGAGNPAWIFVDEIIIK